MVILAGSVPFYINIKGLFFTRKKSRASRVRKLNSISVSVLLIKEKLVKLYKAWDIFSNTVGY